MADSTIVPVTSSCNDWISQHSWQNTDAVGRDGIIEAIINAELRIAEQLGYYPAPAYFEKTTEFPKFHDRGLWNMGHGDAQGRWLDVRLPWGHIEAVGRHQPGVGHNLLDWGKDRRRRLYHRSRSHL